MDEQKLKIKKVCGSCEKKYTTLLKSCFTQTGDFDMNYSMLGQHYGSWMSVN